MYKELNDAILKTLEKIIDAGNIKVETRINAPKMEVKDVYSSDGEKIFELTIRPNVEEKGQLRINMGKKYYVTIDGKTYEDTAGKIDKALKKLEPKSDTLTFLSRFADKGRK